MKKHQQLLDMQSFIEKYNCQAIVNDYPFLKKTKLFHNTRYRRVLGSAWFKKNMIELSTQILYEIDKNIRETLIHEMCHLVAYRKAKDVGHGLVFKQLMAKYCYPVKNRFHQGILTTEIKKVDGKIIIEYKENRKWIEANIRIDAMLEKLARVA